MSARLQTPLTQLPREGWESMLLEGGSKEMWQEVLRRYKKGEEDLFRFRFDLKDVVAYSH